MVIKDDHDDLRAANPATPTDTPDPPQKSARAATGRQEWASCGGCSTRWRAVRLCHCAGCHETFIGIWSFDAHRTRSRGGQCLPPASAGLVQRDGVWRENRPQPADLWRDR